MSLSDEGTNNFRQNISSNCPVSGEHEFCPPQSGDIRSMCPALNAMANHGYINRDGKKVSACSIYHGIKACYGFSTPHSFFLTFMAFLLFRRIRPIDLHELGRHNVIEHDASMFHLDTPDGEEFGPTTVDENLVDEFMNDVRPDKKDVVDFHDIARSRIRREKDSRPINGIRQELARGEMSMMLGLWETTSKDKVGVPTEWITRWLIDGRLPEDWRPTHKQGLWNTIQRSRAIKREVEEMRKRSEKIATTSDSHINDNDERQTLLSSSKKSRSYRIF